MKLKEYPLSLSMSARLLLTPAERLGHNAKDAEIPLIVSLTSIPSRLPILHITIRSLLNQTVKPEAIILWLNKDQVPRLPKALAKLQCDRFQVRYGPMTCSHRKLVLPLEAYPGHHIVTCDDDLMLRRNWLEQLLNGRQKYPKDILANCCRHIHYQEDGQVALYKSWKRESTGLSHPQTLAIGYGGVLYPPGSLHPDVLDAEQFLKLTPKADDLWFKAMAMRQGTAVRVNPTPSKEPVPMARSQKEALGKTNIKQDGNRAQWRALLEAYPELRQPTGS